MKKFSIIMAIIMIMSALTFTLTSCGDKVDTVVGKWKAEVDVAKMFIESMANEGLEGIDASSAGSLPIFFNAEYKDDGTYAISMEADSDFSEKLKGILTPLFEKYVADNPEMAELGVSAEALVDMFGNFSADDMFGEDITGSYKVDGNKLYMWSEGEEASEDNYTVFEFEGNTMKWTDIAGDDEEDAFVDMLPLVFVSVK